MGSVNLKANDNAYVLALIGQHLGRG